MSPANISFIILGYFGLLFLISFITGRKADNDTFFIGNRKSPWYIVAFGMIGASLSGVTFISIPGWVNTQQFAYMQVVLGYLLGYFFVANVLLPVYYKLRLTSIYGYLESRFGYYSYKTGAVFFLISRILGASLRLFIVANVLHITVFKTLHVPFYITVVVTILLIWLYTLKGGIKTIVWTDTLQTFFMLLALGLTIFFIAKKLDLSGLGLINQVRDSEFSRIFYFDDWTSEYHFVKQFISGAFITIVMTGLDQDMMQKNLSCRNLRDAKKNMYWFSIVLVPVNLIFLSLGALLYIFAQSQKIALPERSDDLYPLIATGNYLGPAVGLLFVLGLIAAAYSSADSALTSLTTSFTLDILSLKKAASERLKRVRMRVHFGISILLAIIILIVKIINKKAVIDTLFTVAGYTYGPLLGLYCFGLFTRLKIKDIYVPIIAILSPLISFAIQYLLAHLFDYKIGFELLILNGALTFLGLLCVSKKR